MNAVVQIDRNKGLGASDAAAAIGLSKWKTPFQLWQEKLGLTPRTADNDERFQDELLHLEMGKVLEPVAIARFEKKTGYAVRDRQLQVFDKDLPWRWVTLDGVAADEGLVEAKSVGFANPLDWGDELTDDAIPIPYLVQVQKGLGITGRAHGWVPLIVLNREFRIYRIQRDQEFIDLIRQRETEFMQHVWDRTPPPPIDYIDAARQWPQDSGTTIVATAEAVGFVSELAKAKQARKTAELDEILAQAKVAKFMGENAILAGDNGKPLVTWKTAKPSHKTDLAALTAKHTELVSQFEIEVAGSRRMLVKS